MSFPSSTYRIQFNSKFTFADFKEIIPYLHQLGISTIYAAPITQSIHDSSHGYDVVNPLQINPEIGTREELVEIRAILKSLGMTWIQDIVPNHMAFAPDNVWLHDVLERGEHSPFYRYYDINWAHQTYQKKVLIPVLGKTLTQAIEAGEITSVFIEKGIYIQYFDNPFPVSKEGLQLIHDLLLEKSKPDDILIPQLQDLIHKSETLPLKEWQQLKGEFFNAILYDKDKARKLELELCLEKINEDKILLNKLISCQNYVLSSWQTSEKEMNYRRFFTVNSLICLRMEDDKIFDEYHQLISDLYRSDLIQGVRIDHIDGLADPKKYVERLRKLLGEDCYIIAEKILDTEEAMAEDWQLQGTSGYEFLSFTNRLLTDKAGAEKILQDYREFTGCKTEYADLVFNNKYSFLLSQMQGELDNLTAYMQELDLLTTAFDEVKIKKALGLFMACFPVYRIYPENFPLSENSLHLVSQAVDLAGKRDTKLDWELKYIRTLFEKSFDPNLSEKKLKFIKRLMQFTGPLAAKGVEDTTFYVYNPLISHNEVGDSPSKLSYTIEEFHKKMLERQSKNPFSLNATSTHDTKRGEDARMRINVLAEMPEQWKQMVNDWRIINQSIKQKKDGKEAPSPNDEWFIYQSIIGSFPEDYQITDSFLERTKAFIIKSLREAKVNTTYSTPDEWYENACVSFATGILKKEHVFVDRFIPFLKTVMEHAYVYSLSQSIIKITAPGIPDIYQGSELWELSYVDPDNRRPVDYAFRKQLLREIDTKEGNGAEDLHRELETKKQQGAQKLFVIKITLNLRRQYPDLFIKGAYVPLEIDQNNHSVIAYARRHEHQWLVVVLPLAVKKCADEEKPWENHLLKLPEGAPSQWQNIFTGQEFYSDGNMKLAQLLEKFPVAVIKSN